MADKLPDKDSFFGGLMNAFATGGQATMSAVQEDLDSLRHGKYPQQAFKAIGDTISAYSNPAMGGMIPTIPTYMNPSMEVAKSIAKKFEGKYSPEEIHSYLRTIYDSMTPEASAIAVPTGKFVPAAQPLSQAFGKK